MRNRIIDLILCLGENVDGFDYLFPKLKDMSNLELLELYVEMRIEEYEDSREF